MQKRFPPQLDFPRSMTSSSFIVSLHNESCVVRGIITLLLGTTLALAQRHMAVPQLGYIMLAPRTGPYITALFHFVTHAYSIDLLFLGSGSIMHAFNGNQYLILVK